MIIQIEKLIEQGHTAEEAELVARITAIAVADREAAVRTGRCGCGARMTPTGLGRIECFHCDAVHAA